MTKKMKLELGQYSEGVLYHDFSKHPVLLIAGSTGSGKSNLEHYLIRQIMTDSKFLDFNLILVDCKRVEFGYLKKIDSLTNQRIIDIDESDLLEKSGWEQLNKILDQCYSLLIVTDEFSDLAYSRPKELEELVEKIDNIKSQLKNIGLVLSTSCPRDDVLTPKIDELIKYRICLKFHNGDDYQKIIGSDYPTNLEPGYGLYGKKNDKQFIKFHTPNIIDDIK